MIRNFVYLDSEKLRSLSSQLFEGVTDSVLKAEADETTAEESQKGPVGSGQVIADIFKKRRSTTEMRFLEDHAYTLFENQIMQSKVALEVYDGVGPLAFEGSFFVRVTGKLNINDTRATTDLISDFNTFGAALFRVSNQTELEAKSIGKTITDKDIEKLAKTSGMQMDPKFLASLSSLIKFGFKGMMEFQITQAGRLFSAPLRREYLREPEELTIQKYSRHSQADFTMLGVITQSGLMQPLNAVPDDVKDAANLKHAIRGMSEHMRVLEDTFSGAVENETVIDPLAVYQTLTI